MRTLAGGSTTQQLIDQLGVTRLQAEQAPKPCPKVVEGATQLASSAMAHGSLPLTPHLSASG